MAERTPIRQDILNTPQLQVQAAPVNTFVNPIKAQVSEPGQSKIAEFRNALHGISKTVQPIIDAKLKEQHAQLEAEGTKLAEVNKASFKEAVASGHIPVTDNPWLITGYNNQRAVQLATQYTTQLHDSYNGVDARDPNNTEALDSMVSGVYNAYAPEIQGFGKEAAATFMKAVNAANSDIYALHTKSVKEKILFGTKEALGSNILASYRAVSNADRSSVEGQAVIEQSFTSLKSFVQDAEKNGIPTKDALNVVFDTLKTHVVSSKDTQILEDLSKIQLSPGIKLGDSPEFAGLKDELVEKVSDTQYKTESRRRAEISQKQTDDERGFMQAIAPLAVDGSLTKKDVDTALKAYPNAVNKVPVALSLAGGVERNRFEQTPVYMKKVADTGFGLATGQTTLNDIDLSGFNPSDAKFLISVATRDDIKQSMQNQQSLHNEIKLEAVSNFGVVNEFSPNKALERKAITYATNWLNSALNSYAVNHVNVTPGMKTSLLKQFEQKKGSFLAQQGETAYGAANTSTPKPLPASVTSKAVGNKDSKTAPQSVKASGASIGTKLQPFPSSRDWANLDPSNKKQLFNAINSLGKKNGK